MKHLFANPTVRLAGRALVAALIVALTQVHASGGTIAWKSLAVGAGLAFVEVFTPLNSLVGIWKGTAPAAPSVKPVA